MFISVLDGKTRVSYYYDNEIGSQYYGSKHPMKPIRVRMAHHLLMSYGVCHKMDIFRPHYASLEELCQFHDSDYIDFLRRVTPENSKEQLHLLNRFNLGPYTDCPVFSDVYDFCQLYAGGSIDGAMRLNHNLCDVAVNWAGGLHHAKKAEASGFCYVNDIVLGILELLKYHARVLYIDIDIHHGDGVEEAFYTTDRVMTLSFHKYGQFFPGTGALADIGHGQGRNYSVNVPLADGLDDRTFLSIFKPILSKVMEVYRPSAVVLQCGADSLTGDRLGVFNLTTRGHGESVRFTRAFGLPTLVVGGGGYNIRNVARCWAYEASLCANVPLSNSIPMNDFYAYYAPEFKLHLTPSNMPCNNQTTELEKIKTSIFQQLREIDHAPSVQLQYVPPDTFLDSIYTNQLPFGTTYNSSNCSVADDLLNGGVLEYFADNEFFDDNRDHDVTDNTKSPYGEAVSSRITRQSMLMQGVDDDDEHPNDIKVTYEYSPQV